MSKRSFGLRKFYRQEIEEAIANWPIDNARYKGLTVVEGKLQDNQGRIVIAREDRDKVLDELNMLTGRDKLFQYISDHYIGISKRYIEDWLKRQENWQLYQRRNPKQIVKPLHFERPLDRVQIDITYLSKPDDRTILQHNYGNKYLLVLIDWFSKFLWVRPLKNKSANNVARITEEVINIMPRVPESIQSDNGTEFRGEFSTMLRHYNIKQIYSRPYTPTSQGLVERVNQTLKRRLAVVLAERGDKNWVDILPEVVDQYNLAKHSVTGYSPYEVMYDDSIWPLVDRRLIGQANKMKSRSKATLSDIGVGDYVRVAVKYESPGPRNSYLPNWSKRIYIVKSISETGQYRLQEDGVDVREIFYRRDLLKSVPPNILRSVIREERPEPNRLPRSRVEVEKRPSSRRNAPPPSSWRDTLLL